LSARRVRCDFRLWPMLSKKVEKPAEQ
jgi:hypothetical protein